MGVDVPEVRLQPNRNKIKGTKSFIGSRNLVKIIFPLACEKPPQRDEKGGFEL